MSKFETRQSEILDKCLAQIQSGASSLSDCLEAYPEHAEFLKSHLDLATQARDLMIPSGPSEDFVAQTKTRLLNRIRAQHKTSPVIEDKKPRRLSWLTRPAMVYISLMIAIVMLASGVGVAGASASALPGDSLYPVKLGIEETRLALTQDPALDAELLLQFADRRLEELIALTETSREGDIELALAGYEERIGQLLDLVDEGEIDDEGGTLSTVRFELDHHQEVLQAILDNAPESAHKGLENALERSRHGKDVIEQIQSGGSPSDLAPGQQDKDKENQGNQPVNPGGGSGREQNPGRPPTKTPKPK